MIFWGKTDSAHISTQSASGSLHIFMKIIYIYQLLIEEYAPFHGKHWFDN